MSRLTEAELRAICLELLDTLQLAPPFTAWQLCQRFSEHRGRPIRVEARDLGWVAVVGHLVPGPRRDRILHDYRAPRTQQQMVIYHELMHLLLGHLDIDAEPLTCGSLLTEEDRPPEDQDGPVDHHQIRPHYSSQLEWQAETGATELARLGRRRSWLDEYTDRSTSWSAERGIAAAFGLVPPRWRSR